jgi:site-specific recombinase XerD
VKYLDENEVKCLFQVIRDDGNLRDLLIFRLIYAYGLRISEAIVIKLEDIHPKLIEIKIHRRKGGISRTYPTSSSDIKLLKKWLKLRDKFELADVNPYLFITTRSTTTHISKILVQKAFSKYATFAGIDKTNVHSLRHSIAVKLLSDGVDVFTVKSWLGHNNIQSTMRYLDIGNPEWRKISTGIIDTLAT